MAKGSGPVGAPLGIKNYISIRALRGGSHGNGQADGRAVGQSGKEPGEADTTGRSAPARRASRRRS